VRDLQGKHDALGEALKTVNGELVNRDLEDCEGLISKETREFWAEQLLKNRVPALLALGDLKKSVAKAGAGDDGKGENGIRRPLHNRATARPIPPASVGGTGGASDERAVKIRNRAHEIAKAEGVASPWPSDERKWKSWNTEVRASSAVQQLKQEKEMSQSNTRVGDIRVLAGESLTSKEGYLVKLTHDTGVPEVKLPAAITDYAVYAVIEGGAMRRWFPCVRSRPGGMFG